jgi:hypothetical protein
MTAEPKCICSDGFGLNLSCPIHRPAAPGGTIAPSGEVDPPKGYFAEAASSPKPELEQARKYVLETWPIPPDGATVEDVIDIRAKWLIDFTGQAAVSSPKPPIARPLHCPVHNVIHAGYCEHVEGKEWAGASSPKPPSPVLRCSKCNGTLIWKATEEGFIVYEDSCGAKAEVASSPEPEPPGNRIMCAQLYRSLNRLHLAVKACAAIAFEESSPINSEHHASIWNNLNEAQADAALKLKHFVTAEGPSPSEPFMSAEEFYLNSAEAEHIGSDFRETAFKFAEAYKEAYAHHLKKGK